MIIVASYFEQKGSDLKSFWGKSALLLGTGLGVGRIPFAPGTFGSLWGLPLAWGLQQISVPLQCLLGIVIFLIGIPICRRAAQALGRDDPGSVVFDEIAAFPIIFLVTPVTWTTAVLGFAWFRLFDIWKPWPASRLEKLHGGLGIMIDDSVAGVYAAAALWGTIWLLALETPLG